MVEESYTGKWWRMSDDLHTVYDVAWDGDPKMGGGHHVIHTHEMHSYSEAATIADMYEEMDSTNNLDSRKQNLRIRIRKVTDWKDV